MSMVRVRHLSVKGLLFLETSNNRITNTMISDLVAFVKNSRAVFPGKAVYSIL
jgi:hypothetical protein